jgi:hypothetical protein
VAVGVMLAIVAGAPVQAKTVRKAPAVTQQDIDDLRSQLQALKDRLDEQAQINQKSQADLQAAQADAAAAKADAAKAQDDLKLARQQIIQTIPAEVKTEVAGIKPKPSWADSTSVNGRMYYNMSDIEQTSNDKRTNPSGFGFDVKRFYVGIDHKFNDTFSANITTDLNYSSAIGQTAVFVKKAYLQAKFSDALTLRAGATDLPWIPFMEDLYGNRYVEQTVADRLKYGTSSDWGLHALGKFGPNKIFSYDVAVIDGAGYKAPLRSKGVDFEGRVNADIDNFVLAVGGYYGRLGKDNVSTPTFHAASRINVAGAYVDKRFRLGAEWFQAENWSNVTSRTITDRSQAVSVFGTYYFMPKYAVFANYQWAQPNQKTNASLRDNYFNVGVSYSPASIVDIALVYKRDKVDNGLISTANGTIGGSNNGTYDELGIFTQLRW